MNDASIDLAVCGYIHRYNYVHVGAVNNRYPVLVGGGPKNKNGTVIVVQADASNGLKLEPIRKAPKDIRVKQRE